MDEDNSTRLAEIYQPNVPQVVVIYPYVWKHYPYGNWFLNWTFVPSDLVYEHLQINTRILQ